MSDANLIPIFTGKSEQGESITLYKHGSEIHIQLPNEELQVLPPEESEFMSWEVPETERMYFKIESPVWSGTICATLKNLIGL